MLQHQLSAFGSCATRRHFSQLSHDTQLLLDAGSAQTSCAGLARLLAEPEAAISMSRLLNAWLFCSFSSTIAALFSSIIGYLSGASATARACDTNVEKSVVALCNP